MRACHSTISTTRRRQIFRQLHLLLTPGGKLAFACRSIRDPECIAAMKDGRTLPGAEHMYEIGGLTRHYFTEALIRRLCEGKFRIELLDEVTRMPYGSVAPTCAYRPAGSVDRGAVPCRATAVGDMSVPV